MQKILLLISALTLNASINADEKLQKLTSELYEASAEQDLTNSNNFAEQITELNQKINKLTAQVNHLNSKIEILEAGKTPSQPVKISNNETIEKEYEQALADLKSKNYEAAELNFASFLDKYKNHKLTSNAQFWYGMSLYSQQNYDKAALQFLKNYQQFPKSFKAADSLYKLAASLNEIDKHEEACLMLKKLKTEYPSRAKQLNNHINELELKLGCAK